MNDRDNAHITMNGRPSFSTMTPRPSVDEKYELASPSKEKGGGSVGGFKSFFSRLGGKRLSLPHQAPDNHSSKQNESFHSHSNGTVNSNGSNHLSMSTTTSGLALTPSRTICTSTKHLDVPALYIAYPQAIKAACLAALTVSSDTILRRNMEMKAREKKGKSQRTRAYSKIEMEWTQKMFLLIPSMLLQYTGEGAVDRMPEKILPLTATSVAFASDAITGKPYVLQVSQSANADGSPIMDDKSGRSMLLKLPWKSSAKHVAMSFLLVFDTAKEMDSWMGCIRIETAKLAGTWVPEKEDPEEIRRKQQSDRGAMSLSRRITIRREEEDFFDVQASHRFSRYSRTSRPSLDAGTSTITASTAVSAEQIVLDRLRGSRSHLSMTSRGTKGGRSPDTSPERYSSRRKSILSSPARSRSSMDLPIGDGVSTGNTTDQIPWIDVHQSRASSPSPSNMTRHATGGGGGRRVSTTGLRIKTPSLSSGNRRSSVYSTMSTAESTANTTPIPTPTRLIGGARRGSKPEIITVTAASPTISAPTRAPLSSSRRARPTSMIDPSTSHRQSLDIPRYSSNTHNYPEPHPGTPIFLSSAPAAVPSTRNLQRRSMTALNTSGRPEYGIGPPAFPPPQIPLPKLPPEGHDRKRRSMNGEKKPSASGNRKSSSYIGGAETSSSSAAMVVVPPPRRGSEGAQGGLVQAVGGGGFNIHRKPVNNAALGDSPTMAAHPLSSSLPRIELPPPLPPKEPMTTPTARLLGSRHSFHEINRQKYH